MLDHNPSPPTPARYAASKLRTGLVAAAVFSAAINLLALSSPLFMLQVYNRVLTSTSMSTLGLLSLIFGGLLVVMGVLDALRGKLLGRIGNLLQHAYGQRFLRHVLSLPPGRESPEVRPLDDLRSVRAVLQGQAVTALFDLPWFPFFLLLVFLIHPVLGTVSLIGAIVLVGLILGSQRISHVRLPGAFDSRTRELRMLQAISRQADAVRALGMTDRLAASWAACARDELIADTEIGDRLATVSAATRTVRLLVQGAILGFGAWLVIRQELGPGVMIASSIMMGRALAPLEVAAAQWQKLAEAYLAFQRLRGLIRSTDPKADALPLELPSGHLLVSNVFVAASRSGAATLSGISLEVLGGQAVGVAGPTGAGKSTLARLLVGALTPTVGSVRLDAIDLTRIDPAELGRCIGYLPQTVELLPGTIAQNIARFEADPTVEAIRAAASAVGVHERILRLPDGYETVVAGAGETLSTGERYLIGLARAIYGQPRLLVLDAPDANLDPDAQGLLEKVFEQARLNGQTVIVISHHPRILRHMDYVVLLAEGRIQKLAPRDEFISAVLQMPPRARTQGGAG